jgi:hypothetical protein
MVLFDISDGLAMQIAVSLVGIAAMIATAMLLNLISIKPRQQSAIATARSRTKTRERSCLTPSAETWRTADNVLG